MNEIFGLVLSNISFLIGLIGAYQTNIQTVRLLGAVDYALLGTWTYLYVEYIQALPVFIWCFAYVIVYLFRYFKDLMILHPERFQ